ncbi:MAG TPA: ABC transporter permease [Alphaproteobacteria bacterium]|jgi:polar amino acid transport system permease protein|nr:ABC transporter permease [Alphaproteobacteria bacterium]
MSFLSDLWDLVSENQVAFERGIWLTLQLLLLSAVIAFVLAVPLALMRVSRSRGLSRFAYAYTYLFRGTPVLTQLFLIYYGLSQFDAVRHSVLWPILRDPFPCALIALSLNMAAYVAEVLRGGIEGVPAGEKEAGLAAGLNPFQLYRLVILPRAIRIALPALSNEMIVQMKSTALVSTITLLDLTGVARRIEARTYSTDALFVAGIIYVILTWAIGRGFRLAEWRLNRHLAR